MSQNKSHQFIGRQRELTALRGLMAAATSTITVVYGRRRVGKSRLLNEAFKGTPTQFFSVEGLEAQPSYKQRQHFLQCLSVFLGKPGLQALSAKTWRALFLILSENIGDRQVVVCLDELQWLAAGRNELVSDLKYAWDTYFKQNNTVQLILCGSVSTFMVKKVIRSKALYGRIDKVIALRPLSFQDVRPGFFPRLPLLEALDLYLVFGGIPRYLEICSERLSSLQNILSLGFSFDSPLRREPESIFVSHFANNERYEEIVELLALVGPLRRKEIATKLRIRAGGTLSMLIRDLELADIIEGYALSPIKESVPGMKQTRYRIKDSFLSFFYEFVRPKLRDIERSKVLPTASAYLPTPQYPAWRGRAFERFCQDNVQIIADCLGFGGVEYRAGPYRETATTSKPGVEIDLLFVRKDRTLTVCEIKYRDHLDLSVIKDVEQKLARISNPRSLRLEPVLISALPVPESIRSSGFFARIITLEDFMKAERI